MQFSYHQECGNDLLNIKDDTYKYLIKARRHKLEDKINFRNFKNELLYEYELIDINKKSASLRLHNSYEKIVQNNKKLHLIWSIIDPKTVEKSITYLNEIGVDKITFVYSQYSQKNFKINFDKLEKILINSSCQCGRSNIIKLEQGGNLKEYLENFEEEIFYLDFSNTNIASKKAEVKNLLIGCEGGFSSQEREEFKNENILGFSSNLILRSETAITSASSIILL